MTSQDEFNSGTSRDLTVASLQRLKMNMKALIPAPTDCKVRSMIKFLNARSLAPVEIHRQLCQVYDHTRLDVQHIPCRNSAGRCLIIIHLIARTSRPLIFIFSYTSKNSCPISVSVFRMTGRRWWVSHSGSNPRRQNSTIQGYKSCSPSMTNVSISEVNMLKIAQHLLYLFQ